MALYQAAKMNVQINLFERDAKQMPLNNDKLKTS